MTAEKTTTSKLRESISHARAAVLAANWAEATVHIEDAWMYAHAASGDAPSTATINLDRANRSRRRWRHETRVADHLQQAMTLAVRRSYRAVKWQIEQAAAYAVALKARRSA